LAGERGKIRTHRWNSFLYGPHPIEPRARKRRIHEVFIVDRGERKPPANGN